MRLGGGGITDIASFWHSVCVLVMPAQSFWPACLVEGESMRRTYELMHSTEYISKEFILETVSFRATYVFVYIFIYIYICLCFHFLSTN